MAGPPAAARPAPDAVSGPVAAARSAPFPRSEWQGDEMHTLEDLRPQAPARGDSALAVVMAINFLIIHAAPGDPITYLYGRLRRVSPSSWPGSGRDGARPAGPCPVRPLPAPAAAGRPGVSAINRKPVLDLILERVPATVVLMTAAFVFSVVVGGLWGVVSAVKARTQIDYWVTMVSLFGYSMPTFWLGLILILVFSLQLGWFPTMGMTTLGSELGAGRPCSTSGITWCCPPSRSACSTSPSTPGWSGPACWRSWGRSSSRRPGRRACRTGRLLQARAAERALAGDHDRRPADRVHVHRAPS